VRDAQQRLDMVADLVPDDVCLRDVPEPDAGVVGERGEERGVEVDAERRRAVERADVGRLGPAGGVDLLGEDRQPGGAVGQAGAAELPVPQRLDVGEHGVQERAPAAGV
jgi:hypothetical protein